MKRSDGQEHDAPQTGGTVEVTGNIRFKYQVHSGDCNVFSLTELKELIKADPINWFVDYYLGCPLTSEEQEDEKAEEKYEVISFDVRDVRETSEVDLKIEVLEKYLVLDPDEVGFENATQPMDKDDEEFL